MSPLPPSPPNPEKFSATVSANALLHVKADGFWPSSMEQLGKPMTVLVYFQVTQHKTHFTKDGYMWYLVRFYSFNCPLCGFDLAPTLQKHGPFPDTDQYLNTPLTGMDWQPQWILSQTYQAPLTYPPFPTPVVGPAAQIIGF